MNKKDEKSFFEFFSGWIAFNLIFHTFIRADQKVEIQFESKCFMNESFSIIRQIHVYQRAQEYIQ